MKSKNTTTLKWRNTNYQKNTPQKLIQPQTVARTHWGGARERSTGSFLDMASHSNGLRKAPLIRETRIALELRCHDKSRQELLPTEENISSQDHLSSIPESEMSHPPRSLLQLEQTLVSHFWLRSEENFLPRARDPFFFFFSWISEQD